MPDTEESRPSASRRAFLIGTGAAVAWTAPIITAAPAAAQTTTFGSPPFVASSSSESDTNTNTPAIPTGTQDGDLILAIVSTGSGLVTAPGWTVLSGPLQSLGNPVGARVTSYLMAYTGATASSAPTAFGRAGGSGVWRVALATFEPAVGGTGVAVDSNASLANGDDVTPPFPGVGVSAPLRTVVYLGATGTQGSGRWQSTPGATAAITSLSQGYDLAISYTLDVNSPTAVVDGLLAGPNGETTDTVTYAVSLTTT